MYIQSHLKFKLRTDLQSSDNALYKSVLLEIIQPHRKIIIVGCFYRPQDASVAELTTLSKASYQLSALRISYLISWMILILISLIHNPTKLLMSSSILWYLIVYIL